MVCQRARDRKKKDSNLPAKKRQVAVLTKESLDAMDKEQASQSGFLSLPELDTSPRKCTTVSVSDDSKSTRSNTTSSSAKASLPQPLVPPLRPVTEITSNVDLVQRAIAKRNEEERIRVAKALLYHAFLQASRGE
jgi:hypothetical protein